MLDLQLTVSIDEDGVSKKVAVTDMERVPEIKPEAQKQAAKRRESTGHSETPGPLIYVASSFRCNLLRLN